MLVFLGVGVVVASAHMHEYFSVHYMNIYIYIMYIDIAI